MNVWTQWLYLPVTVFVNGLDLMVRTLQTIQQTAQQAVVVPNAGSLPFAGGGLDRVTPSGGALRGDATMTQEEVREMSDCGCNDQCGKPFCEVRVYDYYILSVKPCEEKLLQRPDTLVITSDMSGEAFTSYAIARFVQKNPQPEEDLKYLRVCYRLNCTFPKERRDCCSSKHGDQVRVLEQIRDAIQGKPTTAAA